jgi:hypothetical protein
MRVWDPGSVFQRAGYLDGQTLRQGTIGRYVTHMLSAITRYEETRYCVLAWRIARINCVDASAMFQCGLGYRHELPRSEIVQVM